MSKINDDTIKFSSYYESKKSKEMEKNRSELAIVHKALKSFLERDPSIEEFYW